MAKDSGSLPSGKQSNRPRSGNGHKKGGNISNDAPAFCSDYKIPLAISARFISEATPVMVVRPYIPIILGVLSKSSPFTV